MAEEFCDFYHPGLEDLRNYQSRSRYDGKQFVVRTPKFQKGDLIPYQLFQVFDAGTMSSEPAKIIAEELQTIIDQGEDEKIYQFDLSYYYEDGSASKQCWKIEEFDTNVVEEQ